MPTQPSTAPTPPPTRGLRVLIADEREADVLAIRRALTRAFPPLDALAVGEIGTLRVALENGTWDLLIVSAENQRCRPEDLIEILAQNDSPVPMLVLDAVETPVDPADPVAAAGHQRVYRDSPARLIEAVERAVRITATGQGRRTSDAP